MFLSPKIRVTSFHWSFHMCISKAAVLRGNLGSNKIRVSTQNRNPLLPVVIVEHATKDPQQIG